MNATRASDSGVAGGFLAGDVEATRTVRGWIDRIVRGRAWRFGDPDNVSQEVTLRLLQLLRADRFRGESAFKTFVHSVATHVCIDTYRREKRLASRERPDDEIEHASQQPEQENELVEQERIRTLGLIYQRLSGECRDLWKFVYFERRPAAEIARELGISVNATRVRVHRCLQHARTILADSPFRIPPAEKRAVP